MTRIQQFRYKKADTHDKAYDWSEWADRASTEFDGLEGMSYQFRTKPELEPGLYRHPAGVSSPEEFYTLSRELRWSYLKNSNLTWASVSNNKPYWSLESLERVS